MSRPDAIPAPTSTGTFRHSRAGFEPATSSLCQRSGQLSYLGATAARLLSVPLLIAAILLSGCASAPPTLFTGVRTVEVRVPVPVPCIDTVPTPPRTEMPTQGDINQLAAGLELDVMAMDAYIELVDKILKECAAK